MSAALGSQTELIERIRCSVPRMLLELPVWLLHDSKKTPIYSDGENRCGTLDSPEDRGRLVTFEQAARALPNVARACGLGIALGVVSGEEVHLSGVDIDGCYHGGELDGRAQQILLAADSYAEKSPSGAGLHVVGTGDIGTLKIPRNNGAPGLEIYSGQRYFTVTGERLNGAHLTDISDAAAVARRLLTQHKVVGATPAETSNAVIAALKASGLYLRAGVDGKHFITCPWSARHTPAANGERNGASTEAAYFAPNHTNRDRGGFKCQHAHCTDRGIRELRDYLGLDIAARPERPTLDALVIEPASAWANRDAPKPRDWICEELGLPAKRVISLLGNGGFGKTTVAAQIMVAVALSRPLWGHAVVGGCVLGFFCEDEQEEIERKVRTISEVEGIELESLDKLHALSRDGDDNVLCTFENDAIVPTSFYYQIDATVARYKPRLTIIDTAADVFAGDFMSTPQVRQFIKVALGGLCKRHETAVLLLAHPSASGMASGDGGGFSVAWNNSVRSRLYLRRPKCDDPEGASDRRIIEIKKANYGPSGGMVPLLYQRGRFILDPEPIHEGNGANQRAPKLDTRLSMAVMAYFEQHASSREVVAFGMILKALQGSGDLQRTDNATATEKVRKQLQRTLKGLVNEGLLRLSDVPRGYRAGREGTP